MRILGIDPALTKLGWGIIESDGSKIHYLASGQITTKANNSMEMRLGYITSSIRKIITEYKPSAISMEITFLNNNAVSSLKLAYVRGAIMSLIGELNIPYYEYSPNQIKKTLVGVGHAEKQQIKSMIQVILSGSLSEVSFDESDALATAYTCFAHS
ncbi:MAG TPA: crossover junction endodeoxyribonuclease RuvC [Candidatus Megaira endosymbiont of Nemacystus decipiens]|nr:crossover junction endodeoxyribonuclease RuvC [Candidatus Megaera endosymbiont of Nemacystus decipiens]